MRLRPSPHLNAGAVDERHCAARAAVTAAVILVLSATGGRAAPLPPSLRQIGPEGGAIAALARAPLTDAPLFAVSGRGDLFRLDSGARWTRVRDQVRAVIPDPTDARLVYALPNYGQLQASRDGGTTWAADSGLNVEDPGDLVFDPERGLAYVATPGAVFRSRDGLRSWTAVLGRVVDDDDATLHLALGTTPHHILYAYLPGETLLRSEDDGGTWMSATLPPVGCSDYYYACGALAVDPLDARRVLLGIGSSIYRSSDGGDSWGPAMILNNGGVQFDDEITDLAIDPRDAGRAYAIRGGRLLLSVDGGAVWQPVATPQVQHLLIDPTDSQRLYAAAGDPYGSTGEGVWVSHDRGANWQAMNSGLFATCIRPMVAASPQTILAALCYGSGLRATTDGGTTWRTIGQGLPDRPSVGALAVAADDPRVVYAGLQNGGIYRSDDGGERWLPTNFGNLYVNDLAIAAGSSAALYAALGRNRVWTTRDGGARWEPSGAGLPVSDNSGQVDRVVADPADPRRAYAVVNYTGVAVPLFRTLDGGAHWEPVGASLSLDHVDDVAVSPADPRQLYAAGFDAIHASNDGGDTWHPSGFPRTFGSIRLAADPRWPDTVYASVGGRLLRSDDRGETWRVLLRALPIDGSNEIVAVGEPRSLLLPTASAGILAYGPLSEGPACRGDCDGNRVISIAELITSVNIAIGSDRIDACGAADGDADDVVSIADLIAAVAAALSGCG